MSEGDKSHMTISKANFIINTNENLPSNNGERCSVKVKYLECDAVLTLLDKKDGGESDENLFSLSINNYDNKRINGNMKSSLENYKTVIYYNSQLKKFYSSYDNEKDKITVKENISHILILGKKDISPKSDGSYILNIDKTILIYEDSHLKITSANESNPALTMYEYFNLIYIDWFSLLLSDFEKEFEKFKSVMPQEVLSAADSDSDSEADSEADFQLKGEQRVVEGVGGEEEGEEEGVGGEGGAEEGDPQSQRATIAVSKIQAAIRAKQAAEQAAEQAAKQAIEQEKKVEKIAKNLKEFGETEQERRKNELDIITSEKGFKTIGGKKKGKKTKKLN